MQGSWLLRAIGWDWFLQREDAGEHHEGNRALHRERGNGGAQNAERSRQRVAEHERPDGSGRGDEGGTLPPR